jgi:hypothetical protein
MELDRQAFNIDFNLSKRTAIPSIRCTSAVRSPAPPLQIRQRSIESEPPALSLRAQLAAEADASKLAGPYDSLSAT